MGRERVHTDDVMHKSLLLELLESGLESEAMQSSCEVNH